MTHARFVACGLAAWCLAGCLALSACGEAEDGATNDTVPEVVAPSLRGDYELAWLEHPGQPRLSMPAAAIGRLDGCIWARWGWRFEEDGRVSISNEMICRSPPELGAGYGACRAGFESRLRWRAQGFELLAPVRAQSRFVNLRGAEGGGFSSATITCNVSVGALEATLTDQEGGTPGRPNQVTLRLADGGQMRLVAIESVDVDHGEIITRQNAATPGAGTEGAPPPVAPSSAAP
ncbi:MAG: hypothetical protein AB7S26_04970 [Sandaracinaceae bacterium]